jgi:arginase
LAPFSDLFVFREQKKEIGLIWIDAHADINTYDSSPSGNVHGMPLAALLGFGEPSLVNLENYVPKLNPEYCAHVGARDLDIGEKATHTGTWNAR